MTEIRPEDAIKEIRMIPTDTKEQDEAIEHAVSCIEKVRDNGISLCPHCFCMTKNVCGKCKEIKEPNNEIAKGEL